MKTSFRRNAAPGILLIAALLPLSSANAQLTDILKPATSSGASGSAAEAVGAATGQSVSAGGIGNITGLLQYCVKNNLLGGSDASSVTDQLMGKLGGSSAASSDQGYQDGAKGLVKSADGKQLDLSGGGTKMELAKQVCDKILTQGKALLKK